MKAAAVPILFGCMIFMAGCAAEGGSTVDKTETLAENIESDNKIMMFFMINIWISMNFPFWIWLLRGNMCARTGPL